LDDASLMLMALSGSLVWVVTYSVIPVN
jgi:hypothetical protein